MAKGSTKTSAQNFLIGLERELNGLPVHHHPFLETFQRGITRDELIRFVRQWYHFGLQFRKILIGLLYNLSDKDEAIGLELTKVLFSEYGQGVAEQVHATQLLRLVNALEITHESLAQERLCPEVQEYINCVGDLFLHGSLPSALGASFAIETTAGSPYRYLYSGLLTLPDLSLEDIKFFETHLFEELHHGEWLRSALIGYAHLTDQQEHISAAALLAMDKWQGLWQGMHHLVFDRPLSS